METTLLLLAFSAATQTFALPQGLLSAVCFVESTHNAKAVHLDDGGENSVGLCQLHLSTAKWLGYKGIEKGLYDAKINAYYAAKYLRYQLNRYDGNVTKAIAAYNAGSYRVNAKGQIKNRIYVQKVTNAWALKR
jgi:soluble lytic murein transglycosylase-like protein